MNFSAMVLNVPAGLDGQLAAEPEEVNIFSTDLVRLGIADLARRTA